MYARNCTKESSEPITGEVKGTIPPWLEGKLIRVGPGIIKVGKTQYTHLFDGMAMLHQVVIKDGTATYRSRFLESDTYKRNMSAERIIVTEFGTIPLTDPCASLYQRMTSWFSALGEAEMTDNCGVNVLQVKDELIAMSELEAVRIIDPEDLRTFDEKPKFRKYVAVNMATAHPHVESDGTVYNYGFTVGCQGPMYSILSLPNGNVRKATLEAQVKPRWRFNPSYFHSFGITDKYFILGETPLVTDVKKVPGLGFMTASPNDIMVWHGKEKSRFRIINRKTGDELPIKFLTDAYFAFHHVNAYEKDGFLVIDLCATDHGKKLLNSLYVENLRKKSNDPTKIIPTADARRYILPLNIKSSPTKVDLLASFKDAQLKDELNITLSYASAYKIKEDEVQLKPMQFKQTVIEMPRINYKYNGKPYRYMYGVGIDTQNAFDFNSLIKLDNLTGKEIIWREDDYDVQEPVFVASPDAQAEDDGVILSLLAHTENNRKLVLLILKAQDMSEVARVEFITEGVVTMTLHGQFINSRETVHMY